MSVRLPKFEVRVKVKDGLSWYSSFLGMFVFNESIKMFHRDARTSEQAMRACEKYGRPISARKVDVSRIIGNPETLPLLQESSPADNLYSNAIAMDEMIWKKKSRASRIKNRHKDKKDLTIE